jgi:UDP-N-acetylmuramyl pentapeptide phosphotransferase/UDP-N-acetylglucosamine-1-phosphate transferase
VGCWLTDNPRSIQILTVLLCSLPAFLAGLVEDLTKKVGVRTRLYASFTSAALGIWLLNASLTRLDTPGLNNLIALAPLSVLFTCFAVGGLTNAVNIIDGINGLASGSVMLMLAGLGVLSWLHQDQFVLELCLLGIAALGGFLVINFPGGRIFLGDGGAYLSGFWLAECAVLLLSRQPDISTWAVLLVCFYPVCETIFSIFRRNLVGHTSSGQADQTHLHHVLLHRIGAARFNSDIRAGWRRHALTSILIWCLVLTCQLLALVAYPSSAWMAAGVLWFLLIYTWIYVTSKSEKTADTTGGNSHRGAT